MISPLCLLDKEHEKQNCRERGPRDIIEQEDYSIVQRIVNE
jgi:hypothetical protein